MQTIHAYVDQAVINIRQERHKNIEGEAVCAQRRSALSRLLARVARFLRVVMDIRAMRVVPDIRATRVVRDVRPDEFTSVACAVRAIVARTFVS